MSNVLWWSKYILIKCGLCSLWKHTWSQFRVFRCVFVSFISHILIFFFFLISFWWRIIEGKLNVLFTGWRALGGRLTVVPEKSLPSSFQCSHASPRWSIHWWASRAAAPRVTPNHCVQASTLLAHESGRMELTNMIISFATIKRTKQTVKRSDQPL